MKDEREEAKLIAALDSLVAAGCDADEVLALARRVGLLVWHSPNS